MKVREKKNKTYLSSSWGCSAWSAASFRLKLTGASRAERGGGWALAARQAGRAAGVVLQHGAWRRVDSGAASHLKHTHRETHKRIESESAERDLTHDE